MTDEILKGKIRKLAKRMDENVALSNQLSGYTDPAHKRVHKLIPKKKYVYVDELSGSQQSGKLLVDPTGNVFSIKAYGQKGHYQGDVDRVIAKIERDNASLMKGLKQKAQKNTFVIKTSGEIILHDPK